MRETIVLRAIGLLEKKGFLISSYAHSNNCFDLAAKKDNALLLIKIFENIDATRPEQAIELKKLATAFFATPIILGEKTKVGGLNDSMVYERYGVNCITINSFEDYLNNRMPQAWHFKGKTLVELDTQKLKKTMEHRGISTAGLAKLVNLAPKTVYGYERGSHSSLETAKKIEQELSTALIKGIDLNEKKIWEQIFEKNPGDEIFEKITKLGLELALFEHAPFEAFGHPKGSLLISKADSPLEVKRKGLKLKETKKIVNADTVIIAKKSGKKSTESTAIIEEEELDSFSGKKDLLETIKEREKNAGRIFLEKKKRTR
ncbi:MAG: helix-turn-helix domain-containing protein [archaeon]